MSVLGCFVGTDASGTMAAPNQGSGVHVFGGNGTRIGGATSGGPCTGDCNVISGTIYPRANVLLDDNATGAIVRGNFIGTDVTGTAAIPNSTLDGVHVRGTNNTVGGTNGTTPGGACTGDCNLISGNDARGLYVAPPASNTIVRGNLIGTDVTGTLAVGNSFGIETFPLNVVIGGNTAAARNVVSGNRSTGIQIRGVSAVVQGNYFGTNSAGTAVVARTFTHIDVYQAVGAMIGGTMPGAGNLISGASAGVTIVESTNTQIVGNRIGTAADGSTPLPNSSGVYIRSQASQNVIGSPVDGAGNIIAFSEGDGIVIDGATPPVRGNAIGGNSIHSNGSDGIDLINNANDNLAPPTILGIGPLHGTSCAPCAVDIFSDAEDQGRVFEGTVFTNDGNWTFNEPVSGPHVTATNTDMSNNTSEFSAPFSVTSPTPTDSPTSSSTASPTRTSTPTRTASTTATATPSHTATGAPTRHHNRNAHAAFDRNRHAALIRVGDAAVHRDAHAESGRDTEPHPLGNADANSDADGPDRRDVDRDSPAALRRRLRWRFSRDDRRADHAGEHRPRQRTTVGLRARHSGWRRGRHRADHPGGEQRAERLRRISLVRSEERSVENAGRQVAARNRDAR